MKKNAFAIIMKTLVVMVMVMVSLSSCQEDFDASEVRIAKQQGSEIIVPELNWTRTRTDENKGFFDEYIIRLHETTQNLNHELYGSVDLWAQQYDYNVEEKYETLDVAFSNNGRTGGEEFLIEKTDNGAIMGVNFFFPLEDGNIVCLSDTAERLNDKPYDKLTNVRLVSLKNVEKAGNGPHKARAAKQYQKNLVHTEIVAELTYNTVGIENVSPVTVILKDTVDRRIMAEDDIDNVTAINTGREIIDATSERCYFTELFTMKSGEKIEVEKSYILHRLFKGIDPYDMQVNSFNFNFSEVLGLFDGTESLVDNGDENWSVSGKTDRYSAVIVGEKTIETRYTLYHESCAYKDSYVVVEFDFITPVVNETADDTDVKTADSDRTGFDKAILTNNVHTVYGGYAQDLSEYVNLYKTAKYIVSEGWDEKSAEKTFTDDNLYCKVDYVIHYSDGEEVRTKFEHNFARSLVCTSNWVSVEVNPGQTTAAATQSKSETPKSDGNWTWKSVTSSIVSGVTLASSSANGVKSNNWTAIEADAVIVTYRGQDFGFGNDKYTISNSKGSVANGVENGDFTDYAYEDELSYQYGTAAVKKSTAPGLIRVEIEEDPFFPKEWGKLLAAYQTVAPNGITRSDYLYTWSLHFEKGVMPVVIQKGSTAPEWHFESFEYVTDSRINGGYYKKALQKWVNSIASDEKDWMLWLDSNEKNLGNMTYSTATSWKWDENHTVSGHPSVFTKRFDLKVENGTLFAKDTYLNKTMTDSHVNKNGGWK